ncbi:hypothetical protein SAY86_007978 [Trapa natans]|uniref:VQ domain-containing protein n=1 Tax=Trapa natans TaxID=22666 RepID=A0AAN7QXI1_TRANT|nr:hypothetical protein SAY86_007978 [Trapa natans]
MDPLTGSIEKYESSVNLVSHTQLPQFPPCSFLHPNPQPTVDDDDPLSNYLQKIHAVNPQLPVTAEDGRQLLTSDLTALSNQILTENETLLIEKSDHYPVDSVPAVHSSKGSHQATAGRKRKKRSRASQRPPITVMTTDESNFRAMVQEYTGVDPAMCLVPPNHHRAGIGFMGSDKLGFGGKPWEPHMIYDNSPLGPFAARTKCTAAFSSRSLGPQFTLTSNLGFSNFHQPCVHVQDPTRSHNGSGKYLTLPRANDGRGCTNAPVDQLALAVNFQGDRNTQDGVIPRR